jgi:hypothetical protein
VQDEGFSEIQVSNLDMALAREYNHDYYHIIITVRNKELPKPDPSRAAESIAGVLIGHIGDGTDRAALIAFKPLKTSVTIFPKIASKLDSSDFVVIDSISNVSYYSKASMTAFLLRKLQASKYGDSMAVLCHQGGNIDIRIGTQMVKFGYHLFGIGNHGKLSAPEVQSAACIALFAIRTKDSREKAL